MSKAAAKCQTKYTKYEIKIYTADIEYVKEKKSKETILIKISKTFFRSLVKHKKM